VLLRLFLGAVSLVAGGPGAWAFSPVRARWSALLSCPVLSFPVPATRPLTTFASPSFTSPHLSRKASNAPVGTRERDEDILLLLLLLLLLLAAIRLFRCVSYSAWY
jgi:hypothetical protein